MSDIVDVLRRQLMPGDLGYRTMRDAADEIERLRQLRHEAECTLVAADANVERLRAALERIEEAYFSDIVAADAAHEMLIIARAALAGNGSGDRNA